MTVTVKQPQAMPTTYKHNHNQLQSTTTVNHNLGFESSQCATATTNYSRRLSKLSPAVSGFARSPFTPDSERPSQI